MNANNYDQIYSTPVELEFLICRIDLLNISGTHVDSHPYSVGKITISNIDKLKIMSTVSSVPTNPDVRHQHS